MSKLIGKIIADASGLTEKLGGEKKVKFDEIKEIKLKTEVDTNRWDKFKQEVKATNGDEILIKAAIDKSGIEDLKKIDELYDYVLLQSKSGKDVDLGEVNSLIKEQNYKNIAGQAHGFTGVNAAIKEYKNTEKYTYKTNVKYVFVYF